MVVAATYIEANGLKIYYEVHGWGEPLLLVHGGTASYPGPPGNRPGRRGEPREVGAGAARVGCLPVRGARARLRPRVLEDVRKADLIAVAYAPTLHVPGPCRGNRPGSHPQRRPRRGRIYRRVCRAVPLTPQCGAGRRPGLGSQLHRSQSGPLRRARTGFPPEASEMNQQTATSIHQPNGKTNTLLKITSRDERLASDNADDGSPQRG